MKRFEEESSHIKSLSGFSLGGVLSKAGLKTSDKKDVDFTKYELQFVFTEPLENPVCRVRVTLYFPGFIRVYTVSPKSRFYQNKIFLLSLNLKHRRESCEKSHPTSVTERRLSIFKEEELWDSELTQTWLHSMPKEI